MRRRLNELAGVGEVGDPAARVLRLGAPGARLLETADPKTLLEGCSLDLVEQVVNRLVTRGRNADALATADEIDDEPRARPCLAGARRPLDEEVAVVERRGSPALLPKVRRR